MTFENDGFQWTRHKLSSNTKILKSLLWHKFHATMCWLLVPKCAWPKMSSTKSPKASHISGSVKITKSRIIKCRILLEHVLAVSLVAYSRKIVENQGLTIWKTWKLDSRAILRFKRSCIHCEMHQIATQSQQATIHSLWIIYILSATNLNQKSCDLTVSTRSNDFFEL